jgi:hypothetical protein
VQPGVGYLHRGPSSTWTSSDTGIWIRTSRLCRVGGQVLADGGGFGGVEFGVEGEGLLEVVSGLDGLVEVLVGLGEAVVGVGLLERGADVAGDG